MGRPGSAPHCHHGTPHQREDGWQHGTLSRLEPPPPFAISDILAIGLTQELQTAGVKIPEAFSVVGFDNIFGSDFTTPALTTIASSFSECGTAALDLRLTALPGQDHSPGRDTAGKFDAPHYSYRTRIKRTPPGPADLNDGLHRLVARRASS
jgi:DNA-binding LacI/PurR family transcriptional regulator